MLFVGKLTELQRVKWIANSILKSSRDFMSNPRQPTDNNRQTHITFIMNLHCMFSCFDTLLSLQSEV